MESLLSSFRVGFRSLRRTPGFAFTAIATLAIGIGLSTAVFTVADALLLKKLPVREEARVVYMAGTMPVRSAAGWPLTHAAAREFARQTRTLESAALVTYEGAWPVVVRDGDRMQRMRRALVSGNFFTTLGVTPMLGRAFDEADDIRGANPVVVLSHNAWKNRFGGDPNIVGRAISIHETGVSYRVVGVMPIGVEYPRGVDLWGTLVPARANPTSGGVVADVTILGRLARTSTGRAAAQELNTFFQRETASRTERSLRAVVRPFRDVVLGDSGLAVIAFAAAAALLLMIACVNVANLLLVRGIARVREIAVRTALGASRAQLVWQLLSENALLALAGAVGGIAIAMMTVKAFVSFAPDGLPRLSEIVVNGRALFGAAVISVTAMAMFALAPAVVGSRAELQTTLRSDTRQTGSRNSRRLSEMLAAAQIALAVIVLSASALVARSLLNLQHAQMSLESSRLLIAELAIAYDRYNDLSKQVALLNELTAAIKATPGVRAVSPVVAAPFSGTGGWDGKLTLEHQSADQSAANALLNLEVVAPEYFATLDVPILRGRAFTDADRSGAPNVLIVSESMARSYWPNEEALGKRVSLDPSGKNLLTVVGIAPDTRYRDLRDARASVYFPLRQSPFPFAPMTLAIRTTGNPSQSVAALRNTIDKTAPGVGIADLAPFDTYLRVPLAQPRMNAFLLMIFGIAAVLLASIGLFAVLATMVRQRTRELGVRLALGATARNLRQLVLTRGLSVAVVGTLVGTTLSLAINQALTAMLFEVTPADMATYAAVIVLLGVVAVAASLIPAVQTTRIDPVSALRAEG